MKIRMQDNSIRLRLTRSEVDEVEREGVVRATVSFPGGASLDYALESSAAAKVTGARFTGQGIVVSVPQDVIRQWAATEQVSITTNQPLGAETLLAILVEKDFACLAPREGEDESDMFPHPQKGQETC
ncbi:MAG: DUF7009 family protein [Woeseiaceae bacterium]